MGNTPGALHLRTLLTLKKLSPGQSNTIIFAVSTEVLKTLESLGNKINKE